MVKDKWLESLMKAEPAPERVETKSDPFVAAVFERAGDEPISSITTLEMSKVHDDGATAAIPKSVFDYLIPEPAAPLAKRALTEGAPMELFVQLSKVDEAQRLVYGIATSETPDRDNEILDYQASKPFFEQWSNSVKKDTGGASVGNLREMHGAVAAGKLSQIAFNDAEKRIEVCAKVVDDSCWKKVLERVYSGFSIGGKYISTRKDGNLTRFVASPSEISLVDRPSCPDAVFQLVKADGSTEICKFKIEKTEKGEAMNPAEHLANLHKKHADHFTKTAESHKHMAAHHEALATHFKKAVDDEGTAAHKAHAALAEDHHDRAEKDSAMASWHHDNMEECEKAAKTELAKVTDGVAPSVLEDAVRATFLKMFGNMVQPSGVSVIAPPRPIIRPGQPQLPAAPNVDPQFHKLFETADDNMEKLNL
jgi:hypothetical protein